MIINGSFYNPSKITWSQNSIGQEEDNKIQI